MQLQLLFLPGPQECEGLQAPSLELLEPRKDPLEPEALDLSKGLVFL